MQQHEVAEGGYLPIRGKQRDKKRFDAFWKLIKLRAPSQTMNSIHPATITAASVRGVLCWQGMLILGGSYQLRAGEKFNPTTTSASARP
jgi:hypothetical protein